MSSKLSLVFTCMCGLLCFSAITSATPILPPSFEQTTTEAEAQVADDVLSTEPAHQSKNVNNFEPEAGPAEPTPPHEITSEDTVQVFEHDNGARDLDYDPEMEDDEFYLSPKQLKKRKQFGYRGAKSYGGKKHFLFHGDIIPQSFELFKDKERRKNDRRGHFLFDDDFGEGAELNLANTQAPGRQGFSNFYI